MGLLLLRAAIGLVLLSQAGPNLIANLDPSPANWILDGLAVLAGLLLLAGLMTPVVAALASIVGAVWWTAVVPPHAAGVESKPLAALLSAMAIALGLLGPGAFSIDARLFGLREIIIPRGRPEV